MTRSNDNPRERDDVPFLSSDDDMIGFWVRPRRPECITEQSDDDMAQRSRSVNAILCQAMDRLKGQVTLNELPPWHCSLRMQLPPPPEVVPYFPDSVRLSLQT